MSRLTKWLRARRGGDAARAWFVLFESLAAPPEATNERLFAEATNDMERLYYGHADRVASKWHHYLEVYDRHFARFRGKPVRVLEIGIDRGGSLQLWRRYFGPAAVIHGLDANPACASVDDPDLVVHIGSQTNRRLLERVVEAMGGLDIVIDDGSHIAEHQVATFRALFPQLAEGGLYICEDLQTAYRANYNGGLRRPGTFIEYLKDALDGMHAAYFEAAATHPPTGLPEGIFGISLYDSIAVIEKRAPARAFWTRVGKDRPDWPATPST